MELERGTLAAAPTHLPMLVSLFLRPYQPAFAVSPLRSNQEAAQLLQWTLMDAVCFIIFTRRKALSILAQLSWLCCNVNNLEESSCGRDFTLSNTWDMMEQQDGRNVAPK